VRGKNKETTFWHHYFFHKRHLDRRLYDHFAEYLTDLKERTRSVMYRRTVERELTRMFVATKMACLRDLTADTVETYLTALDTRANTKNHIRTYANSFAKWLERQERIPKNPITKVRRFAVKAEADTQRRRRSLDRADLRRLVQAIQTYPIHANATNRGGRPRADGTRPAPSTARLTPDTIAKLTQLGRERTLYYRLALLTGLRRGEVSRVLTRHVRLSRDVIDLPGHLTKNGRRAVLPLPPALAADLRGWITDTKRRPTDPLFHVPDGRSMVRLHQRHLRYAGFPYSDSEGRYSDFHSLRKTLNTFLRKRGVTLRLRQRMLRHTATDLATAVYDHETTKELAPVVRLLDRLDRFLTTPV
jgi:site-specific recombinase XerD